MDDRGKKGKKNNQKKTDNSGGKAKLRTSKDIYDRLKWDPTQDPSHIIIGYKDRFLGIMEIRMDEFDPNEAGGDIPWHRVYYFDRETEFGRSRLWDRDARVDLLFGSGERNAAIAMATAPRSVTPPPTSTSTSASNASSTSTSKRSRTPPPRRAGGAKSHSDWSPIPCWGFSPFSHQWEPLHESATPMPNAAGRVQTLSVLTLNVLFDQHLKDQICTGHRIPAILRLLEETNADVIMLQEVESPFLAHLLASPHIQQHYFSTEARLTPSSPTLTPYGQIILSKYPLRGGHQYVFPGRQKRIMEAEICVSGERVRLYAVHLTSDRSAVAKMARKATEREEEAAVKMDEAGELCMQRPTALPTSAARRERQLHTILERIRTDAPGTPVVMAGDFNAGDEEPNAAVTHGDFIDAWTALNQLSESPGFTFDPPHNTLAQLNTITGIPRRMDRILLRTPVTARTALYFTQVALQGTSPITSPIASPITSPITSPIASPIEAPPLPMMAEGTPRDRLPPVPFYLSDHYGVLASVTLTRERECESVTVDEMTHTTVISTASSTATSTATQRDSSAVGTSGPTASAVQTQAQVPQAQAPRVPAVFRVKPFKPGPQPTNYSALVLIPPVDVWDPITEIRREDDFSFERWMPHINLMYPFFPAHHFRNIVERVASTVQDIEPFVLNLSQFGHFEHRASSSVHLLPEITSGPADSLHTLHARLCAAFPNVAAKAAPHESAEGWNAHLTVAQFESVEEGAPHAQQYQQRWNENSIQVRFSVTSLAIIARGPDTPFRVYHTIPLGTRAHPSPHRPIAHYPGDTGGIAPQPIGEYTANEHAMLTERFKSPGAGVGYGKGGYESVIERVRGLVEQVIYERNAPGWLPADTADIVPLACDDPSLASQLGPFLFPLGSRQLGVASPSSDLDLLCVGPHGLSIHEFFNAMEQHLTSAPHCMELQIRVEDNEDTHRFEGYVRSVPDARVPALKCRIGGENPVDIDLLYTSYPKGVPRTHPARLDSTTLRCFDMRNLISINGTLAGYAVLHTVPSDKLEVFRQCLRAVRLWAKKRLVFSTPLGYHGGIAWAVLVAWIFHHWNTDRDGEVTLPAFLQRFFETYADWPWPVPVMLPPHPGPLSEFPPFTPQYPADLRMPILNPIAPSHTSSSPHLLSSQHCPALQNIARAITRSTYTLLTQEFHTAKEYFARDQPFLHLFRPCTFSLEYPRYLIFQMATETHREMAECCGWMESHLILLMTALESNPRVLARPLHRALEGREQPVLGKRVVAAQQGLRTATYIVGLQRAEVHGDAKGADPRPLLADFESMFAEWKIARPGCYNLWVQALPQTALNLPTSV